MKFGMAREMLDIKMEKKRGIKILPRNLLYAWKVTKMMCNVGMYLCTPYINVEKKPPTTKMSEQNGSTYLVVDITN